jgi:hypothetical protein
MLTRNRLALTGVEEFPPGFTVVQMSELVPNGAAAPIYSPIFL